MAARARILTERHDDGKWPRRLTFVAAVTAA